MQPSTKLPDNLKSRLSRVYFAQRSFTDDSGKSIAYERLVLEVLIKDKPFNLEFKISDKDKAILYLADVVDWSVLLQFAVCSVSLINRKAEHGFRQVYCYLRLAYCWRAALHYQAVCYHDTLSDCTVAVWTVHEVDFYAFHGGCLLDLFMVICYIESGIFNVAPLMLEELAIEDSFLFNNMLIVFLKHYNPIN